MGRGIARFGPGFCPQGPQRAAPHCNGGAGTTGTTALPFEGPWDKIQDQNIQLYGVYKPLVGLYNV